MLQKLRGGLSLGQQIFLLIAIIVVLAVGASVAVTRLLGTSIASEAVRQDLERSTAVQSNLADSRLDQLYLRASTVSSDPNFVAYLVAALQDGDVASLIDQLDERQRDMGFDFAIVTDPDGLVVARTDLRGGESTLTDTALFQAAIEGELYTADGIWVKDGSLFYAVLVPLVSSGVLEGCFIASYAIDDAAALELRQITGTEVSFLTSKAEGEPLDVVATTLDPAMAEELVAWIKGATAREPTDVTLGRDRYLATVRPVFNVAGQEVGRVVNLGSLEQALTPFDRIGQVLLVVGLVAVLLALVASFLLPRRLLDPVRNLADAADAAADGRLDVKITGTERRDEVGRLARAFQGLLSELREQRDMQVYLTELTRTLPDADKSSAGETVPAKAETTTVLGVELQGYGQRIRPSEPGASIDGLSRDLRRLSRLVASQGGSLEAAAGHRLLVRFTGDLHAHRALTAASQLFMAGEVSTLVAMASGDIVLGSVAWHNKPTLTFAGGVIDEVENLMRVARSQTLLMTGGAAALVQPLLAELGLQAKPHKTNWSPRPIYSLDIHMLSRLAQTDVGTTMALTSGVTTTMHTGGGLRATLAGIGPGSVLGGRFEIIGELGAGGMGVVYKAQDRELNELVALKMLKQDAFVDERGLEKLKDELKLARKISHPNVLRTFDFGDADGLPFISMEFVRGVTLKELLEQSDQLPASAGLHMARQLCRGLAAAHSQSVLHR
ncbi:MAG: cache domain-containing protein, partial [Acidobacteriota bacterium]